jgi:TolB protein
MINRILIFIPFLLLCLASITFSQEEPRVFIRPTPQEEVILALPDITLVSAPTTESTNLLGILNQVLWEDLKFAGYFTLLGKSFYPPQIIGNWRDVGYDAWRDLNVSYLSTGTLKYINKETVSVQFQLIDMKRHSLGFGHEISGDIRAVAHRWADEVVFNLTAGASRGIASTKITFTSKHGDQKEIHTMDYDGHGPRAFVSNGAMNLFPVWSSDNSKIAFISDRSRPWEINIYSFVDGARLPFQTFNSTASTPSFSPDGTRIAFALSTPRGGLDIFVSKLDGSDRTDITNNPADDTSPTWAPSGRQIAFASKREDDSLQLYICDADGTNVRRLLKERGEADSPSWSPDGKWVAFHWKPRRTGQFDIYLVEVSSGKISQLTSLSGNNVNPSWAPDSRHIAFESDRTGSSQIYIMRLGADPSEIRMITNRGNNGTPAWGAYVDR